MVLTSPRRGWGKEEFYLNADPPAAVLITNAQWPQESGFDAADRWPAFAALLASQYDLAQTGDDSGMAWRLYVRRGHAG